MTILDGLMAHHQLFCPLFNHFWGQMPIFSWVTPTFYSLIRFFIEFVISCEKINGHCRWKNGHLIPKTSLKQGFWGQMPIFSWVTPTFFSLSRFVIEFGLLWTILERFWPIGTIFGRFVEHFRWFWIISQYIRD